MEFDIRIDAEGTETFMVKADTGIGITNARIFIFSFRSIERNRTEVHFTF